MRKLKIKHLSKNLTRLQGEYWWDGSYLQYADGDLGDFNHAGYVMQQASREILGILEEKTDYSPSHREEEEGLDWSNVEEYFLKELIPEKVKELESSGQSAEGFQEMIENGDWLNYLIDYLQVPLDLYRAAQGDGYVQDYALKNWGWKAMRGNNIETWTLTSEDIKEISRMVDEALEVEFPEEFENEDQMKFSIEVKSSGKFFSSVPLSAIRSQSMMEIARNKDTSHFSKKGKNMITKISTLQKANTGELNSKFVIIKSSRQYTCGKGYSGPACDIAGVECGKIYDSYSEAKKDADKLSKVNPMGFSVEPYVSPEDYKPGELPEDLDHTKMDIWKNKNLFKK